MATGEPQIQTLPPSLLLEVEKVARAQERTVSQVVTEAVDRYLKDQEWQRLKDYGRQQASARGLSQEDVCRLIEESRKEDEQAR